MPALAFPLRKGVGMWEALDDSFVSTIGPVVLRVLLVVLFLKTFACSFGATPK